MTNTVLAELGQRIADLRIGKHMKQVELAYEAGVSHRTLQRMEAGEPVKSDGLVRVLKSLDRIDAVLAALDSAEFSPFERLSDAGITLSQLSKQGAATDGRTAAQRGKRRVRRTAGQGARGARAEKTVAVQWPEDQR